MDPFGYLSVLISIILGLAITQILQGVRGLVIGRRRIVPYWPSVAWAGLLLLMTVQSWWAMYGLSRQLEWTFIEFAIVLLQVGLFYMLAALVLPDFHGPDRTDLRRHYFEQRRWFYGLAVTLLVVSVLKDVIINGQLPGAVNLGFHLVFAAVWGLAIFVDRDFYHQFVPVFMILSFGAYIALLFARL